MDRPSNGVRWASARSSSSRARSTAERAARYTRVYWWLWQQQTIAGRRQFVLAVLFGLASRFGHLLVLVVSMKCAIWLFKPSSLPSILTKVLPGGAESGLLMPLLFLFPGAVMFGTLFAQHMHAKLSDAHKSEFAYRIALRSANQQFGRSRTSNPLNRKDTIAIAGSIGRQFERLTARLVRVETNVLSIIIQTSSLIMAMLLGMFLNPVIAAVTLTLGFVSAAVFVSFRHGHFQKLTKEREVLQRELVEARKRLLDGLASRVSSPVDARGLEQITSDFDSVARRRRIREAGFRSLSNSVVSGGQSVLILGLLLAIYLWGAPKEAHEIGNAIVLLVVLRAALGLIRSISVSAVALSGDYVMLVELAEGRAVTETESGDAEMLDREDQDI